MMQAVQWEQPLHRLPRLMLWFLALSLLAAIIWASVANVRVYALVRGTLTPQLEPVQVNVPSAGRVVKNQVKLWQKVSKGDLLFTLDALSRDSQDAALQLSIQQNAATQARQDIAQAEIDLQNKQRQESSVRTVYNVGGVPRADMEAAEAAVNSAQAALRQARSRLASAEAQLKLLTLNQKVEVTSPIDGQVMQVSDLHVGQTLGAGQSMLAILPAGVPMVFKGTANEKDRPKLKTGAQVQIAWNGYPRQKYGVTKGKLSGVSPTSEVSSTGLVLYQVEVSLPRGNLTLKERPLLPGMIGEAQVLSDQRTVLQLFWDWVRGADPWS
ncbi:efflux RND transporter periplasmic adaptor subunit [Deinococcus fonticola]|uniref:efflux RND transporter periplasmic adaptor subunit n=1 Tax=Deinococcus fonticola TaxID=2528713 RepID=UPI001074E546|nr:HlyD family efflux transporter periplasmic adaptor subunit [Deinococcus fonticola]